MSKFSNFKIKWPKSVEKLDNGGRLGPLRQDCPPPPQKKNPLNPLLRSAPKLNGITLAGCDRRNGQNSNFVRMTMIDQGDGEEVVWGRFLGTMNHQIHIQHLRKPH